MKSKLMKIIALLLLVVFVGIVYFFFQDRINGLIKALNSLIKQHFKFAIVVVFVISLLDSSIGLIGPGGSALYIASLYYPHSFILLAMVSFLGFFAGVTIMYFLGKYFSKYMYSFKKSKVIKFFEKNSDFAVLFFSSTAAANVVSVIAGLSKMKFWKFASICFVGRFIITYCIGTNIFRLWSLYIKNNDIFTLIFAIALTIVCIVIYGVMFIIHKRMEKNESSN